MPHMVVFRTNEGKQGYHLEETLDGAVRFVEHLRNNEQVAESKVYRMHEVPIEFKVIYKVEVSGSSAAAADDGEAGTAEAVRAAEPAGGGSAPRPAPPREDRAEPQRATMAPGPTVAPGPTAQTAPSPVAQTGGRFGLFSRS